MIEKILQFALPEMLLNKLRDQKKKRVLNQWKKNGCPSPPPHIVKQMTVTEYQQKYKYNILVETGTCFGNMVSSQKKRFKKIISIELGVDFFERAVRKFKKDKHIILVQGDSGKVLPNVLSDINEPAIFWLDGHYSAGITARGDKDSPILQELESILSSKKFNHVLLIDDARCFNGERDYPTIEQLTEYIRSKNEKYQIEVKHDIICCVI